MSSQQNENSVLLESLVIPSYQWAIDRTNAADARIQHMLMLSATVTVAFPLLADRWVTQPSYLSILLLFAGLAFVAQVGLAYWAQAQVRIELIDFEKIRLLAENSNTDELREKIIAGASRAYTRNRGKVIRKTHFLFGMVLGFMIEMAFLIGWLACSS